MCVAGLSRRAGSRYRSDALDFADSGGSDGRRRAMTEDSWFHCPTLLMFLLFALRPARLAVVTCLTGLAVLQSCAPRNTAERPRSAIKSPREPDAVPSGGDMEVVLEVLEEPEVPPFDVADARRLLGAVEGLGRAEGHDSLAALFALLLGLRDPHTQRAVLFSLVRRAPASLEMARQLLGSEMPELSRRVHYAPQLTSEQKRLYERGLAAAVLGASGLAQARQPLLHALATAASVSERALLVVALTRLERRDDSPELLLEALATTPEDAEVSMPVRWGLTQLVPNVGLLPCSFEIARLGAPMLVVEALAEAAQDRADEQLAPRLLELAQRVASSNSEAADNLIFAAVSLAEPSLLAAIQESLRHRQSEGDAWIEEWVAGAAKAYATCHEDLACHSLALGAKDVNVVGYKSGRFVAARTGPDQGPALLARMEDMPHPQWLSLAVDQRLSHPTIDEVLRVEKLAGRGNETSDLFELSGECAGLDSPLEELAIRLEVRRQAGE